MMEHTHSFIDDGSFSVDVLADTQWLEALATVEAVVKECVAETFFIVCPKLIKTHEIEVTISLSDNDYVQELNKKYRGKDRATNVLSFANYEGRSWRQSGIVDDKIPLLFGDIILAYGVVAKEAKEQNKKFESHLSHLVVHGCLHLLGYDHLTEEDAEKMEGLEKEILFGLGIKNPYV